MLCEGDGWSIQSDAPVFMGDTLLPCNSGQYVDSTRSPEISGFVMQTPGARSTCLKLLWLKMMSFPEEAITHGG